jgi:hypothetical protein
VPHVIFPWPRCNARRGHWSIGTQLSPFVEMRGNIELLRFMKTSLVVATMKTKMLTVLEAKCPSLYLQLNHTYTLCSKFVENSRYKFFGISIAWQMKYKRKGTLFSKWSALRYRRITTKITSNSAHAYEGSGKFLKLKPRYRGKENFSSKLSAFHYWPTTNNRTPFLACAHAWYFQVFSLE